MIKCTECMTQNKLTAKFCINCGKSLQTDPKLEDVKPEFKQDTRNFSSNNGTLNYF
jgi:hypothetical protein